MLPLSCFNDSESGALEIESTRWSLVGKPKSLRQQLQIFNASCKKSESIKYWGERFLALCRNSTPAWFEAIDACEWRWPNDTSSCLGSQRYRNMQIRYGCCGPRGRTSRCSLRVMRVSSLRTCIDSGKFSSGRFSCMPLVSVVNYACTYSTSLMAYRRWERQRFSILLWNLRQTVFRNLCKSMTQTVWACLPTHVIYLID